MTQTQLGDLLGKAQAWVSRLENPDYGKMTVATLLELAEAFDTDLEIKFRPFSKLLDSLPRQGPAYFMVKGFESEFGEAATATQPAITAAPNLLLQPGVFIQPGVISTYTTLLSATSHAFNLDTATFVYSTKPPVHQLSLGFRTASDLGIAPSVYWGEPGISITEEINVKQPLKEELPNAA